ncbi:DUF2563 family protein [Mycobacterium noviomagense]|uniref:ESX-1 secretion-associated protein n=1 Tax=Mycobacterium noviomagense TaxID=459858 RepID=A0A7I7P7T2_9MYCO|nr:DUF2563 family protein [Mycobacterium noviomagense]ORB18724.1 hypothetical protein BST37_00740 [Mycobacterium noviomagense]BBY04875.1 hypothetical protein MNVI_01930 [Mycobacterium noviomagense]
MYVNTGLLHSGADDSHRAGQHADNGANHLAGTSPVSGMFGNFDAAHTFCDAVTRAHTDLTARLRAHKEALTDVDGRARTAAADFSEMEKHNAATWRAVRCSSEI